MLRWESYICERLENAHFYDNGQLLLSENPQIIKITTQSLDQQKLEQLTNSLHTQVPHFAVSHQSPYRLDITAVVSTVPTDIEITSINAQKGSSLLDYAKKDGLKPEEIIAIGDSENDYSMLGLPYIESIAMGNADDIIQEICLHHTTDNDHDGVAIVLEQILSKQ